MADLAPPVVESDFGIAGFLTSTPGVGGRIKVRYEDFVVEELGANPPPVTAGPLTAALVRLTNWETNRFVREASARLGMSRRGIHFAGTKDKRGVTTQWFTVRAKPDAVARLSSIPGVEVLETYPTPAERALGDHAGNRFHITVRHIDLPAAEARARANGILDELKVAGGFPNFYGPQRFGTQRPTTHIVGQHILRGDFKAAIDAYVATPSPDDPADVAAARARYLDDHSISPLLKALEATGADFERALLNALANAPDAPERALNALPRNLQTLFVFAYQSFLFNRILSRRIRDGLSIVDPVVGDLVVPMEDGNPTDDFLPVLANNLDRVLTESRRGRLAPTGLLCGTRAPLAEGEPGRTEQEVLAAENVGPRDFVVPEAPNLSSKGSRRPLGVRIPNVEIVVSEDERTGKTKATLSFDLPRGAYATVLLREFLKADDVDAYA